MWQVTKDWCPYSEVGVRMRRSTFACFMPLSFVVQCVLGSDGRSALCASGVILPYDNLLYTA